MALLRVNHTLVLPVTVSHCGPSHFRSRVCCDVKHSLSEHLQDAFCILCADIFSPCLTSMQPCLSSCSRLSCGDIFLRLQLQWALPHCSAVGCDPRTRVFMNESLCQSSASSKAYWNFTWDRAKLRFGYCHRLEYKELYWISWTFLCKFRGG